MRTQWASQHAPTSRRTLYKCKCLFCGPEETIKYVIVHYNKYELERRRPVGNLSTD